MSDKSDDNAVFEPLPKLDEGPAGQGNAEEPAQDPEPATQPTAATGDAEEDQFVGLDADEKMDFKNSSFTASTGKEGNPIQEGDTVRTNPEEGGHAEEPQLDTEDPPSQEEKGKNRIPEEEKIEPAADDERVVAAETESASLKAVASQEQTSEEHPAKVEKDSSGSQEDQKQKSITKKKPHSAGKILTLAAVLAGIGVFILFKSDLSRLLRNQPAPADPPSAETATAEPVEEVEKSPAQAVTELNREYRTQFDEAARLRDDLLARRQDIARLKQDYRSGIEKLQSEIVDLLVQREISSLQEALKIKRIELGLRTIQRRLAYIDLLNEPLDWLLQGSEELLYLKRQALLDLELLGFASGIDMNRHERYLDAAIEKYRPKAEKLTIDSKNADLAPFDQLWQPIVALKKKREAQKLLAESKEQAIWDEICNGNFDRLNEVERLSPQAANCVSKIPGSDLFLNNLTDISADAARHLFQWRGNWICLNGCKTLSSEVAAYLFSWDGNWISLNGLTTFSEEIGEKLLNWKGLQLELMGLQVKANGSDQSGLKYLVQWEKSGGKLYVPHEIRQKLDQLL